MAACGGSDCLPTEVAGYTPTPRPSPGRSSAVGGACLARDRPTTSICSAVLPCESCALTLAPCAAKSSTWLG